jgi:hypothetical protein
MKPYNGLELLKLLKMILTSCRGAIVKPRALQSLIGAIVVQS